MKSFFGTLLPASMNTSFPSTVLVFDKILSVGYRSEAGQNFTVQWELRDVVVSYLQGTQVSEVKHLPSGTKLFIEGNTAFLFINEMKAAAALPWYKKNSIRDGSRIVFLLLFLLAILVSLYFLLVPWVSEKLSSTVSIKNEQQLGNAVYDAMNLAVDEDKSASFIVNDFFAKLEIPTTYAVSVTVVNSPVINAFALPGGRIVIYSALLQQLESYPELAALLAHEFIHVNNRHATKSIFRKLGSKVFLGLLLGRMGSVTTTIIDHADDLKSLTYSRKLEKEADIGALRILEERHIDPAGFEDLFIRLKNDAGSDLPEFLGSHPDIDKRITYIKESSKLEKVIENDKLKSIFEQLKK